MRIAKAELIGMQFNGFIVGNADLIVADFGTDKVKRIRGKLARYAIAVADRIEGAHDIDALLENLPGEMVRPKQIGMVMDDDCQTVAFTR